MNCTQNVLVTGANGFVASHLIPILKNSGYKVTGAVRTSRTLTGLDKTVVVGDLGPQTDWSEALKDINIVIHLAAVSPGDIDRELASMDQFETINRQGTINLAQQAVEAPVQQFLFMSTAALLPVCSDTPIHEAQARIPSEISNQKDCYARAKGQAEQDLREIGERNGLGVTIIRPPMILGHDGGGNVRLLRSAIEKGIPLPFRSVTKNRRDYISVDVLSAFVLHCIQRPESIGSTFHVSDGKPLSTRQLIVQLGKLGKRQPRLFPFPQSILTRLLNILGKKNVANQLLGDFLLDTAHANAILDWKPPESGNISMLRG